MVDFKVSVTPAEERRLKEFISALRTRCTVNMHPESIWNNERFESEFRSKLLTHHCFMGSPLFQESFDSAFIAACSRAGHQVAQAPDGQRFWDVMIDGRRISLNPRKQKAFVRIRSISASSQKRHGFKIAEPLPSVETTPGVFLKSIAVKWMPLSSFAIFKPWISMNLWKFPCLFFLKLWMLDGSIFSPMAPPSIFL